MADYVVCTLADKNYKRQAEMMIESSGTELPHILCLDEETYKYFYKKPVRAYRYEDVDSRVLQIHRESHTWEQHCWALASYFLRWLRKRKLKNLLYVDADIYFYKNIDYIQVTNSIGIIEHRFKSYDPKRKVGHYNVGIIYFADDGPGNACLNWWNNVVMNDGNEFYDEYGTCGDQKYLELFQVFWPNGVEIIDVGHGAPWNTGTQSFDGENVVFRGQAQPLVFFHFSHFRFLGNSYATNRNGEWLPENTWAKPLYDDYYENYK